MKITKEELQKWEDTLIKEGYRKMNGHFESEDYGWWKSITEGKDDDGETIVLYQLAILIYDFSKHVGYPLEDKPIGVSYKVIHSTDDDATYNLSISDDLSARSFEVRASAYVDLVKREFKRYWHFDCWDRHGNTQEVIIEALNADNATLVFKAKHPDLGFDSPY